MSMYNEDGLITLVQKHFGWLNEKYGISIESAPSDNVDLIGGKVHLRVMFSADLPQLVLLHKRSEGVIQEFDIWDFLTSTRREEVRECFKKTPEYASINERNEIMLEVISCSLKVAGDDILMGEYLGSE